MTKADLNVVAVHLTIVWSATAPVSRVCFDTKKMTNVNATMCVRQILCKIM